MHKFRVWWNSFKTVALLISFITNIVFFIVLIILLMNIFQIKNGILEPLIDGLHRNFVGLDEAVIVRTIDVNDQIPVQFDLPLQQDTNVVLTSDVPIAASATFTLPGGGGVINGRVDIVLPSGLVLPIRLDMTVPVDTSLPVHLPVDVEIPLKETQLHAPFNNLRELLEPYVRAMDNLPASWDEVPDFAVNAAQGEGVNLLSPTTDSENPWPGPNADKSAPSEESIKPGQGETLPPAPTATPAEDLGILGQ